MPRKKRREIRPDLDRKELALASYSSNCRKEVETLEDCLVIFDRTEWETRERYLESHEEIHRAICKKLRFGG